MLEFSVVIGHVESRTSTADGGAEETDVEKYRKMYKEEAIYLVKMMEMPCS